MNEAAIGLIGGAVGSISRVLYAALGLSGRWAIIGAVVLTTGAVGLYGLQQHVVWADHAFDYFIAWADILAVAAGSFHILEEAPKAAMDPNGLMRKLTGTGDGK